MTRIRYFWYVLARSAEAAAIVAGSLYLAQSLQRLGYIAPFLGITGIQEMPRHSEATLLWWVWPAAWAVCVHVALGPKQQRPVYLKRSGAMYVYAGVAVSRDAGCRGGCVTGATGSGKTLACIMPRLHSLCINEPGIENPARRPGVADRECAHFAASLRSTETHERESTEPNHVTAHLRYRVAPWGGFVCGEKGNEWEVIGKLLTHHGRSEDLCVLRTRPADAAIPWTPKVRFNLLSIDTIPADTYAKMLVDTFLTVEESATRDEFFVPQARDKIAWGLRLLRAVDACRRHSNGSHLGGEPSLVFLLGLLTVQESYKVYLKECTARLPALTGSEAFTEARFQLENNYWNQPPDQLGGVRSTVYNFLSPFAEPDIAAVFCADSTFDLRDIQRGTVVSLAVPQRFALQRRYVATLLKTLVYQIVLERFDLGRDDPEWINRNVVVVEQDEWQRHAVRADCEVDVVREANGAVYAATQSQNAVWLKLGGRDNAAPLIANLRNRWICQAATQECAEESSGIISGRIEREVSYSHGDAGRTTNVSFSEKPHLPQRELRSLRPFHVVFAPAEGNWLYRKCIAMPATPEGHIPEWWFGAWNPGKWLARALGLPERLWGFAFHSGARMIPPWRAAAPSRAILRWLCGLDGTFIILGGKRVKGSQR